MILSMFHNSSRRSSLVRSLIIRHQKYIVAIIVIAIVLTIYSINWSVRMNEEVQISKTINGPITHMLQITKSTERYTPKCTDPYFRDKSIIIMVTSAPDAFERRTAIRETWGSMPANVSSIGVTLNVFFLLGETSNKNVQDGIVKEAIAKRDILQGTFVDSYVHLTIKSLFGMRWAIKNCKHRYYVKTDQDMWINTPKLLKHILSINMSVTHYLSGHVFDGISPERDHYSKYSISREDYKSDIYPRFTSGTAYFMSRPVLEVLYECAVSKDKRLHLEDVFITGICGKENSISHVHNDLFNFQRIFQCGSKISNAISAHEYSPRELRSLWALSRKGELTAKEETIAICNIYSYEIVSWFFCLISTIASFSIFLKCRHQIKSVLVRTVIS